MQYKLEYYIYLLIVNKLWLWVDTAKNWTEMPSNSLLSPYDSHSFICFLLFCFCFNLFHL
jgi:hypothetical protein